MSVDQSPVYAVKAVPLEKIVANDYNPNIVAPPEMKLLELSIWDYGHSPLFSPTAQLLQHIPDFDLHS